MDFEEAERSEPTQALELTEDDIKGDSIIPLCYVKFQSVNSVTIFVQSNQGEETTRILYFASAGVAQWIECGLQTKGLPVRFPVLIVRFPVEAHAGQVPSRGHVRDSHMLMFLSLSLSPSLPLSLNINK